MYRKLALDKAGTVNPQLPTGEDDELCMRIRNCGFKLARIKGRMAVKYTEQRDTLREVLRRSRTRMYDYGAVVRYSSQYGAGWQYRFEAIPYVVTFAATALLVLLAAPAAVYFDLLGPFALRRCCWHPSPSSPRKAASDRALLSIAVFGAVSTFRTVISYVRTKTPANQAYPTDVIQIR